MSPKLKSILIFALCAIIIIGLAAGVIINTRRQNGTALKNADAVVVNGKTYKAEEVDFYYNLMANQYASYNNQMQQTYGLTLYDADFSKSLFDQTYDQDTGITWGDFLLEQAVNQLYNYIILEEAGKAAGYELPEEANDLITDALVELKNSAAYYGMTEGQYLKAIYGNAIDLDKYVKYATREVYAQYYSQHWADALEITDAELAEQYNAHKNDYDTVDYRTFTVKVTLPEHLDANGAAYSDDTTKAADAAVLAEALQDLDARLKAVTSEEEFLALAEEMTRGTDADGNATAGVTAEETMMANIAYASLSDDIKDWMFDAARTTGDTNINSGTSTLVAFYFLDRSDRSELTRDVRQILFASDKESDTIKGQAVEVLAMYNNGEKSSAAFAELAKTYSEDTNTNENGGLYENIYYGQMVTAFNDWIFDDARKTGDVEIIYNEGSGYHLLYFVGETDRTARQILADADIRDARYEAYIDELEMLYPLTTYEAGLSKID